MAPDRLAAQEHPLHAPFTSADFRYVVKKAKLKRAADALRWRADIIKQMNSEAVNAICKLCKRITANPEFIPEPLRPYFFGARLIPIAKKDGGVRPIAIGSTFLPQTHQLCCHVQPSRRSYLASSLQCSLVRVFHRRNRECNAWCEKTS